MIVAITGANGFVGSNLAAHFLARGYEVLALVRPAANTSLLPSLVTVLSVDYSSPEDLGSKLAGADIVIHNAGKTRTRSYTEMIAANVSNTRQVLSAINKSPSCSRFIYISSQAASRPTREPREVTEEEAPAPVDWYGRSKALAERIIRAECDKDWTIVRPASVYGPGDRDFLALFRGIQSGINIRVGTGRQQLSLIHVSELCTFAVLCAENEEARNQVFFASDGHPYSQNDFAAVAMSVLGKKAVTLSVPVPMARIAGKAGDMVQLITRQINLLNSQKMKELLAPNWVCSIQKARRMLGWNPQPDLAAQLNGTISWYRSQGWL